MAYIFEMLQLPNTRAGGPQHLKPTSKRNPELLKASINPNMGIMIFTATLRKTFNSDSPNVMVLEGGGRGWPRF